MRSGSNGRLMTRSLNIGQMVARKGFRKAGLSSQHLRLAQAVFTLTCWFALCSEEMLDQNSLIGINTSIKAKGLRGGTSTKDSGKVISLRLFSEVVFWSGN